MTVAAGSRPHRPRWRRIVRWLGLPPPVERWLRRRLPRRLFARSILIIVVPMIVLQSVVTFVFLDRHWENMTQRLSVATASEIAAVVELLELSPPELRPVILQSATDNLFSAVNLLPGQHLPAPHPKRFFSLLDRTLSREISRQVARPFWIDTVESTRWVEIRVKTSAGILQIITRRSHTYASDSHITLVWMVGTSLVLIAVALLFLKGQVRPIQELAAAAESFGRGKPVDTYRPHGAIEVRQAAWAFLEMRQRIERHIEQRTAMLAGVSHDLRTILTRFRLELALLGNEEETRALSADVDEMQAMLEDYLAFARTDIDEHADDVVVASLIAEAVRGYPKVKTFVPEELTAPVRPTATRRLIANLVGNAVAYAHRVEVRASTGKSLIVTVDDDGPGIPESERRAVFQPFYRLDSARNRNRGGTGLGLTIARDIARRQGGDVVLGESPLGGLRATVRLPL
ncbi:ATP-binding protein [Acuticoccus mangrovi]|uniref:histidine kinase n=1 Tax=Acuticoccus mangrovi TaxID=2796142 RepID=A0A934IPD4_9HYPH|nr:ATP-binding protein [Acuticoccus mangrovi]MBJ3775149.1 two-component sensor histidine kinase [Acuticoccus mangrovi]